MQAQDLIYLVGDILLLTAIPALVLFVGFYFYKSPWSQFLVGRSLMYFAVSLLVIIATVAASVWLGTDYYGREWIRLASYLLVSITTWRLFFTLRYVQKQGEIADELNVTALADSHHTENEDPLKEEA